MMVREQDLASLLCECHKQFPCIIQVINVTKIPGPKGPPGYNGTQGVQGSPGSSGTQRPSGQPGPPGSCNLTLCSYVRGYSAGKVLDTYVRPDVEKTESNEDLKVLIVKSGFFTMKHMQLCNMLTKPSVLVVINFIDHFICCRVRSFLVPTVTLMTQHTQYLWWKKKIHVYMLGYFEWWLLQYVLSHSLQGVSNLKRNRNVNHNVGLMH